MWARGRSKEGGAGEERTIGQKVAKDAKARRNLDREEDNIMITAMRTLSDKLGEECSATMAASNAQFIQEQIDNYRKFQLKRSVQF